jgi:hypothetical protein
VPTLISQPETDFSESWTQAARDAAAAMRHARDRGASKSAQRMAGMKAALLHAKGKDLPNLASKYWVKSNTSKALAQAFGKGYAGAKSKFLNSDHLVKAVRHDRRYNRHLAMRGLVMRRKVHTHLDQ